MRKADLIPFKYRRRLLGSPPVSARHAEWSAIASNDDEGLPSPDELVELTLEAAARARSLRLDGIAARCRSSLEATWINHWPGDHYRFLAALAEVRGAARAVEVGTLTGMGTLALAHAVPVVVTYDILDWSSFEGTLLRQSDFRERVEQRIGNLADPSYFAAQRESLREADIIFVDGPKDGQFERLFLPMLANMVRADQIVLLDDIRTIPMLQLWRDLPLRKLDVTSFGHWSGTGLAAG